MTEVKWGLVLAAAAIIAMAAALHRQRALSRGGLALVVVSSIAIAAAMGMG